ncbi:MAG: histidine kinase [Gordonia sp. (in: high G+C Gram-positive bacteria)]
MSSSIGPAGGGFASTQGWIRGGVVGIPVRAAATVTGMSVSMFHGVSLDRVGIRGLLSCAVIVSAVVVMAHRPAWAIAVGAVAACAVVGVLVLSLRTDPGVGYSARTAVILAVSTSAVALALPGGATVWIPYIGISAAGGVYAAAAWKCAATAIPGLVVLGAVTWSLTHNFWGVLINLVTALWVLLVMWLRVREREIAELAAAQREIIAEEHARAVAAEQQSAMAAQLHDVLAHTLSGLIVTLQGASLAARRESVSADLADTLSTAVELARSGLAEARAAVDSLRGAAETDNQPLAQWFSRTIEYLRRGAGLSVSVTGAPADIPQQWHALARSMLMEALTNTVRHAAGAPVLIELGQNMIRVLSIGNPDEFVDRNHLSGGHGLIGLAERVSAAGGSISYGATPQGFELTMRMA